MLVNLLSIQICILIYLLFTSLAKYTAKHCLADFRVLFASALGHINLIQATIVRTSRQQIIYIHYRFKVF
jgi:hypothetical protein